MPKASSVFNPDAKCLPIAEVNPVRLDGGKGVWVSILHKQEHYKLIFGPI